MNYLEWNNAIIKHFFNSEKDEKEVMLYFSEQIIEEIGISNFPKPDDGYIDDFYKALRLGVNGITNDNYIQRIISLEQKCLDGSINIDGIPLKYPPYFTYFLAFILPFTSGRAIENLSLNNFHDYVKEFFTNKQLSNNYDGTIKYHLNQIDFLWKKINNWLIEENNFGIGYLEEIDLPGNRSYVGKFEYHILFRKEQEERLSLIFDEKDILPGEAIREIEIRELLVNNYRQLRLSLNTRDNINKIDDYIGNKIVKRALSFYKNWDGVTHTVEGQRGYSRNRLVLCLDFNVLTQKIKLKYFRIFSKNGIPENLMLQNDIGVLINDTYQVNQFYSNPIDTCFIDLKTDIQLVDNAARSKYSWKARDFYIFKKISDFDWVEIPSVEYNVGKTLIVCHHTFYEQILKDWFDSIISSKKLYYNNNETQLPVGWLAFTIDSITLCPHPKLQELIPGQEHKPKINFDKAFYIDGKLFKDKLPIVWIENTENNDCVIAKYEDGFEISLNQLTIDDGGIIVLVNQFLFLPEHFTNQRLNKQFKLVSGNISTHRFLEITDFHKKDNEAIEKFLPKRVGFGQITDVDENYLKGLEHFFSRQKTQTLMPFQNQLNTVFVNQNDIIEYNNNSDYCTQHIGNILIHYISEKGQLSKKEFDDCVFSLLRSSLSVNNEIKNPAIRLRYLLQDLGYVDYNIEKSIFCINKPHLVVIPSERGTTFKLIGAIDVLLIKGILIYCRQHTNIILDIQTDENNLLLPQAIYLNLRQARHELILPLVKQFIMLFKKSELFTQFAIISCFPEISNWEEYINKTPEYEIQNIEGGYIFDIESLKFVNKPNDFEKELSFIKYTNINGYKTIYRLWYKEICYNIPDQQLGIYLYSYLCRQIAINRYDQCVLTRGWINCRKELEQIDQSQLKTNILVFDPERKLLAVPLTCRLPRYFSTSFILLSGRLPIIKKFKFDGVKYDGPYYIYHNVPKLFLENNLNYKLLKRTPQNPIFRRQIIL
jgi:hypothetical protein